MKHTFWYMWPFVTQNFWQDGDSLDNKQIQLFSYNLAVCVCACAVCVWERMCVCERDERDIQTDRQAGRQAGRQVENQVRQLVKSEHYVNQSRGYFNGGRPPWPPTVPRLAARPSQSNPRGSGPEVLKRERGHVTVETWRFCVGVFRAL